MQSNGKHADAPPVTNADPAGQSQHVTFGPEVAELLANSLSMRSRLIASLMDPRRDIDKECGYPPTDALTPEGLRTLYDREPIAGRVVQLLPKESWQHSPTVAEDDDPETETAFEKAWADLAHGLHDGNSWLEDKTGNPVWEYLLRADILSGIGQFGIILLGVDDGQNLMVPVKGSVEVVANQTAGYGDSFLTKEEEEALLNNRLPGDAQSEHPACVVNRQPFSERELRQVRRWGEDRERLHEWAVDNAHKLADNADTREDLLQGDRDALLDAQLVNNRLIFNARKAGKTAKPDARTARADASIPKSSMGGVGAVPKVDMGMQLDGATDQYYGNDPGIGLPTGPVDLGYGPVGIGTDQQYYSSVVSGPSQQLADKPIKPGLKLMFLRVYDESLVQIVRYEWSARNPRFGLPVMYRVTLNDPREQHAGVGLPLATVFVHWSRVIHVADNLHSSEVFGFQRMRQCLNPILDIMKVRGAGAEGYWQSCFTGLSFETHPQLGGDVAVNPANLRQQIKDYRDHLTRTLLTMGMEVKTLAPVVNDPTPHITLLIEAICIVLGCPVRVFKGSERGELASTQDDEAWNDRLRHRQQFYITPRLIRPFIDRLIILGILPEPEKYSVEWPDLDALGDKDRAAIFAQIVGALAQYTQGDVESVMPLATLLMKVLDWDHETIEQVQDDVEQALEERQDDAEALADKHGFTPTPPEGFQAPPEPPQPQKLNPGQKLVHPPPAPDGKPPGTPKPAPNPAAKPGTQPKVSS